MKKSQKYSILLLLWLFLLSSVNIAFAGTPNYVGVENNNSFTWNTTYDKGPIKDLIGDMGEEYDWSDNYIEEREDEISTDEDLTQVKIVILDVDDEEKDPWGEDGVRIIYNFYMKEEGKEFEEEKTDETWAIWKYDKDVYADHGAGFLDFDYKNSYDVDEGEWSRYKWLHYNNPWFTSAKANWKEIADELDEYYDEDEKYDEVKIVREDGTNGIQITLDEDEDDEIEASTIIVEYDDNGVLMYYEAQYDGEPHVIVAREYKWVYDYFWFIVIGIIAVIAVIVIIIIKVKK